MGWVCIPKTQETTVWTLTAMGITATHKKAITFPRSRLLSFRSGPAKGEGVVKPLPAAESGL